MDKDKRRESEGNMPCCGKRYIFAILAFFGLFISYMNRVDMSVAILVMVKRGDAFTLKFISKIMLEGINFIHVPLKR